MSLIVWSAEIKDIGERIREARRDANLTQDELGEALGLSGNAISKIENGYSSITVESLIKLPDILRRPDLLSYLLNIQTDLTADEDQFLGLYRVLSPSLRKAALGILRTLVDTAQSNQ